MNEIDTSQLLVQMRSMAAAAQGQDLAASASVGGVSEGGPSDFGALLQQSFGSVNELKQTSDSLTNGFVTGAGDVSLAELMIAKQKSSIAFEATIQVRNKLLDAYKQVMAMQV